MMKFKIQSYDKLRIDPERSRTGQNSPHQNKFGTGQAKLKIVFSFFLLTAYSSLLTAVPVAPYYDFQFTQGASIPSSGDWYFTINLVNDFGLITKLYKNHSIIGLYELKYLGPGLKRQEGEKFADRYLDYLFVLRYNWLFGKNLTLKAQFDYLKENRRTVANEAWGLGLYDYNRTGGLVSGEKIFGQLKVDIGLQYHFLEFPNYTDLLKEFQQGTEEAESSAGKQNHHLIQLRTGAVYKENRFNLNVAIQQYTKQKVITNIRQPDGTYYSSELQKDIISTLSAERVQKLRPWLVIVPSINVKNRTSNQNYQHFESAGSTVPVSYQAKYYDYTQLIIGLPFYFQLSKKWELVTNPEFDYKLYTNRPPRDENNNFVAGEKQRNFLFLLTLAFNKKSSDISTTTFFYTYQQQTSNMKFEKYLSYNYSGHFFGFKYSLRY